MADKKTSDENVLGKSAMTLNTVIRLADGSTGDNYQASIFDLENAITVTQAAAVTLLGNPSGIMLSSDYKITTLGITGVDHVIISGRNMIAGNSPAQAWVTALSRYVDCDYNVQASKIKITIEDHLLVTQVGGGTPTFIEAQKGISGNTYTANIADVGYYAFAPSLDFTGFTKVNACVCGELISGGDPNMPLSTGVGIWNGSEVRIYTKANDGSPANGLLTDTLVKITAYIYN